MLKAWRRRCFHGINAIILLPQIFEVTANENARYKRNELEYLFVNIGSWQYMQLCGKRKITRLVFNEN